jgi:hypothetical protein
LMDWHLSLMRNEACSHGDSEFHYGVHRGRVFEKMMTQDRREAVFDFFRDSFLERLDAERAFAGSESGFPKFDWMSRFNSISVVAEVTALIWIPWWSLDTPGRAVAALEYCSALMYPSNENPFFPASKDENVTNDSWLLTHEFWADLDGWKEENIKFLGEVLTLDFVKDRIAKCAVRLTGEPESELAQRMEADLPAAETLLALRIEQLPRLLRVEGFDTGWVV